ncbi:MAG TPA: hypothetical protein VK578_00195 [Edaphobacter sp.]|jgi:hypothetical protein|nr:hypothetical protein [Edaphobacter sp.]
MILRTAHQKFVVCPHCLKKHGDCSDWVKNMPHRETCECGEVFLCWFETETTYRAESIETAKPPKVKKDKRTKDKKKRKKRKKKK